MKRGIILLCLLFASVVFIPQPLNAQTYSISGMIVDGGGRGIDGVQIAFFDGEVTDYEFTSGGGIYSHSVSIGWSGTVTPNVSCYSFTPASESIGPVTSDTVRNFLGIIYTYTISGTTLDGTSPQPIPGVLLTLSVDGIPFDSTASGPDGSYSFTVNCGLECTVTPMKVGWNFSPPSLYYESVDDDYEGQDFTGTAAGTTYTISGTILEGTGRTGMDGVTITFYDGSTIHEEITSGGGIYSYTVPVFWTGTVTPNYGGYTFTPTFATVPPVQSNVTLDFTASFDYYTISGVVTDNNLNPLEGVTLTLSTGGTDITGPTGTYSFNRAYGWSGTVTPSRAGWVFEPIRRTYTNLASDQTLQNYMGYEGGSRVTISGAVKQSNGTGIPGITLTFTPGNVTATTDDNGEYSKLVLSGWSGTVTPFKTGYTFSPTSRTYSNIRTDQPNQDYIDYSAGGGIPEISLSPNKLNFTRDGSLNVSGDQSFLVSNSGGGTLNWTISPDQSWITASPSSGTDSGYITVSVDASGKAEGTYNGTITVSDPNATNSPQTVNVQLEVHSSTNPPFGEFSTPLEGSTIRGSVPFTGWALDDVGVESVKIYRKENGSLYYIGDAVFVEGARPDVALYYPDYPHNNRAGWGYMMLTFFLPNGGNGTYTFCAIATDMGGNEVTLDTRTVTIDNANADKPFGAIDTPTQGGEASGGSFKNSGWVLTPWPNRIPEDGSTINVYLDGVNLGHPTYNIYREDIAMLLPDYANSNGAHAYFDLDTTTYSNGVHTIYWTATDDAGNTDGIGSRFFIVNNPGSSNSLNTVLGISVEDFNIIPIVYNTSVRVKKGFSTDAELRTMSPDKEGNPLIHIKEIERIEISLSNPIAGFMVAGNKLYPLPVGSTLDTKNNSFSWIPGPGFVGDYTLVFIEHGLNGELSKRVVFMRIAPKYERKE